MRFFFLTLVLIYLTGCSQQPIKNITDRFLKHGPEWVEEIQNGTINKRGDYCYSSVVKVYDEKKYSSKIKQDLKSQISKSLNSFVSVETKTQTSSQGAKIEKYFKSNTSISSFAQLTGIDIKNIYYDKDTNTAYGYICLSKAKFKELEKENRQKLKEYLGLMDRLNHYINIGDKDAAENVLNQIYIQFPSLQNSQILKNMQEKIEKIMTVDIKISREYRVGDKLSMDVTTNRLAFLNVVLIHNHRKYLLFPKMNSNNVINNTTRTIILMNSILPKYKGKNTLIFYISEEPLNLMQYEFSNNELDVDYEKEIENFKKHHYLKTVIKTFVVKPSFNTIKVCIQPSIDGMWGWTVYSELRENLSEEFLLTRCARAEYKIKFLYNDQNQGNYKKINVKLKLIKNRNILDEEKYNGLFFKSKKTYSINYYIVPLIMQKIDIFKEFMR